MRALKFLLLIFSIIALSACQDNKQELENYVAEVKKTASGSVEKIPAPIKIKMEDYAADNFRNPFVPAGAPNVANVQQQAAQQPKESAVPQQPRPDAGRPREYLEQFPLADLVMVGTLSKPQMNWGLLKDSQGMIHVVKVDDYIGQNSGKIIAITRDQIRLVEIIPNGSGGWMQSRNTLLLVTQKQGQQK